MRKGHQPLDNKAEGGVLVYCRMIETQLTGRGNKDE
jgi:hypothetical protein